MFLNEHEYFRFNMKSGSLIALFIALSFLCLTAIALSLWLYFDDSLRSHTVPSNAVIDLNKQFRENTEQNIEIARRMVKPGGIVALNIDRFCVGMKRYPRSLAEMREEPDTTALGERWSGPYINNPDLLIDPWGKPYQYLSPGIHNPLTYDFWSNGGDGLAGTVDDIGNW